MGSPPGPGPKDYFQPGDWNAICSMCGFKFKFSELEFNWQGTYRCPKCNEPRHPQDFVQALNTSKGEGSVPIVQKEFDVDLMICTFNGISAIPGYAMPGCMIPGRTTIDPNFSIAEQPKVYIYAEDGITPILNETGLFPLLPEGASFGTKTP